jgi:hypothetical protein
MNFNDSDPELMRLISLLPNVDPAPLAPPTNNAYVPIAPLPRVADAAYAIGI